MHLILLLAGLVMPTPCPLDTLEVESEVVRWNGIEIGAPASDVEAALGQELAVVENLDTPGFHASVPVRWGTLVLHFGDHTGVIRLTGITARRLRDETPACWTRDALIDATARRAPDARYLPSRHAPDTAEADNDYPMYLLDERHRIVVLLKPSLGAVYIGYLDVLD